MDIEKLLQYLKTERGRLDEAIAILNGSGRIGTKDLRARHMSAEARRKISEAQKRRWARRRRGGKNGDGAPTAINERRSRLSAAARKRLSEMMKKRWAERRKLAA